MRNRKFLGLEEASFSADRSEVALTLRTDEGPLGLALRRDHLDPLISMLESIACRAVQPHPGNGHGPIQPALNRKAEVVETCRVAMGMADGVPSVLLGLAVGNGRILRWFALSEERSNEVQRALASNAPALANLSEPPAGAVVRPVTASPQTEVKPRAQSSSTSKKPAKGKAKAGGSRSKH